LNENRKNIFKIQVEKLNVAEFDKQKDLIDKQLEQIKFAGYDNFRVLKATDNYIEKYLPFTV